MIYLHVITEPLFGSSRNPDRVLNKFPKESFDLYEML